MSTFKLCYEIGIWATFVVLIGYNLYKGYASGDMQEFVRDIRTDKERAFIRLFLLFGALLLAAVWLYIAALLWPIAVPYRTWQILRSRKKRRTSCA